MLKFFKFSFCILVFLVVIDPGNSIFGLKEIIFLVTFILGLFVYRKISFFSGILSLFLLIGLIFPLYGLLLGLVICQHFSIEYAVMYLKAFLFLSLILVSYRQGGEFGFFFSVITLLLIPLTIIIWGMVGEYTGAEDLYLFKDDTVVVARRAFGPLLIDPVVFYKTSPLLIFGLSFLCSENRFRYNIINIVVIGLGLWTMFISGTRANMISSLFICVYFLWDNVLKKKLFFKYCFVFVCIIVVVVFLPYVFNEVFFNVNESSLSLKKSLISSYILYWDSQPHEFLLGSGLGAGMPTSARGIEYMMEPTYLELIRFWGIIFFPVICFFLILYPIYLFYINRKSSLIRQYKYIIIAYLMYVFVEIPSNPLLMSSTGMIVLVVVYSVAFNIHIINRYRLY